MLRIALCETDPRALEAWRAQFAESPDVDVREHSILETDAEALVIPGNGFGYLEDGVGLAATEVFGMEIQDRLRARILEEFHGELLVGQAIDLWLPEQKKLLLYTPIWRVPTPLADSVNVFLAVRGALLCLAQRTGEPTVSTLAIPAMGLDPGGMHPYVSARQIRYAFEMFALGTRGAGDKNLTRLRRRDRKLRSVPNQAFQSEDSGPSEG